MISYNTGFYGECIEVEVSLHAFGGRLSASAIEMTIIVHLVELAAAPDTHFSPPSLQFPSKIYVSFPPPSKSMLLLVHTPIVHQTFIDPLSTILPKILATRFRRPIFFLFFFVSYPSHIVIVIVIPSLVTKGIRRLCNFDQRNQ